MSEPRDPFEEFNQAVHEFGSALAESLHLPQFVDWLNQRLTR